MIQTRRFHDFLSWYSTSQPLGQIRWAWIKNLMPKPLSVDFYGHENLKWAIFRKSNNVRQATCRDEA
jgi:hypothetical protein